MTIGQIDLVEISEAFAAQVIPLAKQMGIAMETLNIHNGAIALGHPFGMTGAHIITTLIYRIQPARLEFDRRRWPRRTTLGPPWPSPSQR